MTKPKMLRTVLADLGTDLFIEHYARTGGSLILAHEYAVDGVQQFLAACEECAVQAIDRAYHETWCDILEQNTA